MEGLEDALQQLLNDPAQLAELASLASSLGLSLSAAPSAQPPAKPQPMPQGAAAQPQAPSAAADAERQPPQRPVFSPQATQSRPPARQEKLLSALKPFLKPSRQEKLDRALRLAQLSDLAGAVLHHSGGKQ